MLSKSGDLFSIGSNKYGQLGLNDVNLEFSTAPLLIQEIQCNAQSIKSICAGGYHNMLLTSNGQILSWGSNAYGQCGHDPHHLLKIYKPMVVYSETINTNLVSQIDTGNHFSGFVTEQGAVYTFGSNSEGQLGIGMDEVQSVYEPQKVVLEHYDVVKQISLGYQHMLLLTGKGDVLAAGQNEQHQLGLGCQVECARHIVSTPIRLQSLIGQNISKVIAGSFSGSITYDGQLYVWGQGEFGSFKAP